MLSLKAMKPLGFTLTSGQLGDGGTMEFSYMQLWSTGPHQTTATIDVKSV